MNCRSRSFVLPDGWPKLLPRSVERIHEDSLSHPNTRPDNRKRLQKMTSPPSRSLLTTSMTSATLTTPMAIDHGFEPIAEHYVCMVDMFGRSGQLRMALDFIERIPNEPGSAVWGTLLGACMIHKDTTLARLASERLFSLDPENVGYYVLLSNTDSVDKKFPLAASIRQVVKRRSLVKTPGCTLIEIGEVSHVFTTGDWSHPQSDKIYMILRKLVGKMEAGYKPETTAVLQDVEDEEKEMMFEVQSEKLAIAFGLIATERGADIRIIKNLRVCLDYHNATKFVSKITDRLIVVRDCRG